MKVCPAVFVLLPLLLAGCRDGGGSSSTATTTAPTPAASTSPLISTSAMVLPDSDPIAQPDDHGDAVAGSTVIRVDEPQNGLIESQADHDWFSVDLDTGQRYDLAVFSMGSTRLSLLAPDGVTELANAEGQNPRLAYLVPANGRYLVKVGSVAGPLDYTLVVSRLSN